MTMAEFLDWEQRQPTKHEFDGIGPIAMAGGTLAHAPLQANLAISVGGALEVLSPSTAGTDRIVKAREYQATPSVQRYVMLEQDRIAATVFARLSDGWSGQVLAAGDTLAFPELGISVPLDDLYVGIALPELPDGAA